VLLGFLEGFAHPDHLGLEVDVRPAERQDLAATQTSEQGDDRPRIHRPAAQLVDQLADPLLGHDLDFAILDGRSALEPGNVLGDQIVSHGVVECL
jgi:hypothetical protein